MNQQLTVNKEYWLDKNPGIKFRKVKKAFYGTYLLKASVHICGASIRYYNHSSKTPLNPNPTIAEYVTFLKQHVMRFSTQKIVESEDKRYIHVVQELYTTSVPPRTRIYDTKVLFALFNLRRNKPEGVYLARELDSLRIYSNDIELIDKVLVDLKIDDDLIKSIDSPRENEVTALLSGKEFNIRAEFFKFKVYLKPTKTKGLPELTDYLKSVKDTGEVHVPKHCWRALAGPRDLWSWSYMQRSYLYARDEDTILLIQMLAVGRYSDCIELIMPDVFNDK